MKLPAQQSTRNQPTADVPNVGRSTTGPSTPLGGEPAAGSAPAEGPTPSGGAAEAWKAFDPASNATALAPAAPSANGGKPADTVSWVAVQLRSPPPSLHDTARKVLSILAARGVSLQEASQPENDVARRAQEEVRTAIDESPLRGNPHALLTGLRLAHAIQVVPGAHEKGAEFLAEANGRGLAVLSAANAYPEAWSGTVGVLREGHPPLFGAFVAPDRPYSATFGVRTLEGTVRCSVDDLVAFAASPRVIVGAGIE